MGQKETDKAVTGDKHVGTHLGCRCFWDADTDQYSSVTTGNDNYFCCCTAYSVYQY